MNTKVIIFSAPSGSGKSTLINHLVDKVANLSFSISATSRPPRGEEEDGVDYYFLSPEAFRARIEAGEFLEYEEVYQDRFYGTLKAETERLLQLNKHVVFDVDVVGGKAIKNYFGDRALSIFIKPPSIEALKERLEARGTDEPEVIQIRLDKAAYELGFSSEFDQVIVNDVLEVAKEEVLQVVNQFLQV